MVDSNNVLHHPLTHQVTSIGCRSNEPSCNLKLIRILFTCNRINYTSTRSGHNEALPKTLHDQIPCQLDDDDVEEAAGANSELPEDCYLQPNRSSRVVAKAARPKALHE